MKFEFIKSSMPEKGSGKQLVRELVEDFNRHYLGNILKDHTIVIDFRKTVNEYRTEGLFGGFLDMYDKKKKRIYHNPNNFYEFVDPSNARNAAHLAMHEMVHTWQMLNGDMKIINPNLMRWKGKKYDRAPFRYDFFSELVDIKGSLGERYHKYTLPWERQAYELPEDFMGHPLHYYMTGENS